MKKPIDAHRAIGIALFLAASLVLVKLLTGWPG